jgi:hypothetical protein
MGIDYLYEIIVIPDDGTTGQNLIRLINTLALASRLSNVVVLDVECNGNRTWAQQPPFLSTTQEVMNYAQAVGQFDWATFFFFPPAETPASDEHQFETLFAKAHVTIRAVDDTYFYVYSPIADDATLLSKVFPLESNRTSKEAIVHPT